jgi:glycosyltransferase involved in cell wall biosynthesis
MVKEDETGRSGHVAVLLGLRDGARFLRPQLESLVAQSHRDWSLIVSDDGSADAGPARLAQWAETLRGRPMRLVAGPRRGLTANYLHLLRQVPDHAALAAFCDQDDFWLPEKLARAARALGALPRGIPAMSCGRVVLVDARMRHIGVSPGCRHGASFANALVQNIATGMTVVLNRPAIELLASAREMRAPFHDWWAYLMISGAGGRVLWDDSPQVLYRQHPGAVIGSWRGGFPARRLAQLLAGRDRDWAARNIEALTASQDLLTDEARRLLARFAQMQRQGGWQRSRDLARAGLHRQGRMATLALHLAAIGGLA